MSEWKFITDFGDGAVTLPLIFLIPLYLAARHRAKIALAFLLATGACAATIGCLKVLLRSCSDRLTETSITSPSGHTAMSVVVYGTFALLATNQMPSKPKYLVYGLTAAWVAAIGVSRLALAAHTLAEVALGMVIGAAAVTGFWFELRQIPPLNLRLGYLSVLCALAIIAMHGINLPVEQSLRAIAVALRGHLPGCG